MIAYFEVEPTLMALGVGVDAKIEVVLMLGDLEDHVEIGALKVILEFDGRLVLFWFFWRKDVFGSIDLLS